MCFGSTATANTPANQAAQAYFRQQVPNSRFANNPGYAALFGSILAKRNGVQPGGQAQAQSTSAAQPRQQYQGA